MANATPPAPPATPEAPPDPTGPFVHARNDGKQNVRIGGRFFGPKAKCILRGSVPDNVCIVDTTGAVVARLPAAEVRMLARMQEQGALDLTDPAYLVAARPVAAPTSTVNALSW